MSDLTCSVNHNEFRFDLLHLHLMLCFKLPICCSICLTSLLSCPHLTSPSRLELFKSFPVEGSFLGDLMRVSLPGSFCLPPPGLLSLGFFLAWGSSSFVAMATRFMLEVLHYWKWFREIICSGFITHSFLIYYNVQNCPEVYQSVSATYVDLA